MFDKRVVRSLLSSLVRHLLCSRHTANAFDWPKQSGHQYKRAEVCFNYNRGCTIYGYILRCDSQGCAIILLDNGFCVVSAECQYRVL